MLIELTSPFIEGKDEFVDWLKGQDYPGYEVLLKKSLEIVCEKGGEFEYGKEPDPDRIHRIGS